MLIIAQKSVYSNYKDYWYVSFVDTALTFQEIENRIMPGSKDIIKESNVFVSNRNQLKLKSVCKHLTQDAGSVSDQHWSFHQRLTQYFLGVAGYWTCRRLSNTPNNNGRTGLLCGKFCMRNGCTAKYPNMKHRTCNCSA